MLQLCEYYWRPGLPIRLLAGIYVHKCEANTAKMSLSHCKQGQQGTRIDAALVFRNVAVSGSTDNFCSDWHS